MTGSALFPDRDDVINVDRGYVHSPDQFRVRARYFPLARFWIEALRLPIVVVSSPAVQHRLISMRGPAPA
jgi:histidinol phosphatase-like enzyme